MYCKIVYSWIAQQLDIGHWAYASIFAAVVQLQIQNQFWISHGKIHNARFFSIFHKIKNCARMAIFLRFGRRAVF